MTRFGRVREGVTGSTIVDLELITEGKWMKLPAWFCNLCPQARPFSENPSDAQDEILRHFAQLHPDELLRFSLTEQPKPVRVRSSLVDEHGKPMYFEREG